MNQNPSLKNLISPKGDQLVLQGISKSPHDIRLVFYPFEISQSCFSLWQSVLLHLSRFGYIWCPVNLQKNSFEAILSWDAAKWYKIIQICRVVFLPSFSKWCWYKTPLKKNMGQRINTEGFPDHADNNQKCSKKFRT